jgi:hypothetical protein
VLRDPRAVRAWVARDAQRRADALDIRSGSSRCCALHDLRRGEARESRRAARRVGSLAPPAANGRAGGPRARRGHAFRAERLDRGDFRERRSDARRLVEIWSRAPARDNHDGAAGPPERAGRSRERARQP